MKKDNIVFFVALAIAVSAMFALYSRGVLKTAQQKGPASVPSGLTLTDPNAASTSSGQDVSVAGAKTQAATPVDPSGWKTYKNDIYKFQIKYPDGWRVLSEEKVNDPDFDYEYRVAIGTDKASAGDSNEGIRIFVFPTNSCSTSVSSGASSLPSGQPSDQNLSSGQSTDTSQCSSHRTQVINGNSTSGDVPMYEFSSKGYTFTIIPFIQNDGTIPASGSDVQKIIDASVNTFSYDPSTEPQKAVQKTPTPKPKAVAAQPVARPVHLNNFAVVGGKLVCPHPGRKPQRSPNKGNHVDEDCCPDPDEWPNPSCSYSPADFSIMLKGPAK